MEWRDRRHSFVDVLERVTDGVHVAIVDRGSLHHERNRDADANERPPTPRPGHPPKPRSRPRS